MSDNAKSSDQNWLVNIGSRSLIMESGIPWSLTTVLKIALAADVAIYGCPGVMKWADFENLSTTVRMIDFPLTRGNPLMKSIVTSTQIIDDMPSGCRRPVGCNCSSLFL
jgi:hypothetical protein